MENAADALKMAGAVLIFVLAISITILSFGQVREASDTILDYRDRETTYEYYKESSSGLSRTVNLETIIPAIFRAYLENYKIVFDFGTSGNNTPIYSIRQNSDPNHPIDRLYIDLETQGTENNATVGAPDYMKAEFIRAILYGNTTPQKKDKFKSYFPNIILSSDSNRDYTLYKRLKKARKITEQLGVYYKDDNPNEPEVMKEEKRVITYIVEY